MRAGGTSLDSSSGTSWLDDHRVPFAAGLVAIALVALAATLVPWWSSGKSMIGMSLDLRGVEACFGNLCEHKSYSDLPREAFGKHATPFVALGRVTFGLGLAASIALLVHLAVRRSTSSKVTPARLALLLFAAGLATAVAFFALRPAISLLDPQLDPQQQGMPSGPPDELGNAMMGMLVPKLSVGLGFPMFALGAVIGIGASILWLRRIKE
jgi:hypothetical protein